MGWIIENLQTIGDACIQLLTQPFYYIGIIFVMLLYRRNVLLERKLFLTKIHSTLTQTWRTLLWGILAGFIVSSGMLVADITLHADTIVLIWLLALLFILFRARFFCFAYAIGTVGILHSIIVMFNFKTDSFTNSFVNNIIDNLYIDHVIALLRDLHMPTLLALVAVAHIAEALLFRWTSTRLASPVAVQGKRGRFIGGYRLESFWVLPLFLVVPVEAHGWTLLAFPFVIGFSVLTTASIPKQKAAWTSSYILIYSFIVLALAYGVFVWPNLAIVASVLCILLHEMIGWYSAWRENEHAPFYVHDKQGLRILAVTSGSPAEQLGIKVGEQVVQVNGVRVSNRVELHDAFNRVPAYCKLEVLNLEGNSKFMQRPIFEGEHYQLGLIFAPDDHTTQYTTKKQRSVISFFKP